MAENRLNRLDRCCCQGSGGWRRRLEAVGSPTGPTGSNRASPTIKSIPAEGIQPIQPLSESPHVYRSPPKHPHHPRSLPPPTMTITAARPDSSVHRTEHKRPAYLSPGVNFCPRKSDPLITTADLCEITVYRIQAYLPWVVELDFRASDRQPNLAGWVQIGKVAWEGLGVQKGKRPIHEMQGRAKFGFPSLRHAAKAAEEWEILVETMSQTGLGLLP